MEIRSKTAGRTSFFVHHWEGQHRHLTLVYSGWWPAFAVRKQKGIDTNWKSLSLETSWREPSYPQVFLFPQPEEVSESLTNVDLRFELRFLNTIPSPRTFVRQKKKEAKSSCFFCLDIDVKIFKLMECVTLCCVNWEFASGFGHPFPLVKAVVMLMSREVIWDVQKQHVRSIEIAYREKTFFE